jgi:hypothetical protein
MVYIIGVDSLADMLIADKMESRAAENSQILYN